MRIKDLYLGRKVKDCHGFVYEVVGLWKYDSGKVDVYCTFEGNEGDPFEFAPEELMEA